LLLATSLSPIHASVGIGKRWVVRASGSGLGKSEAKACDIAKDKAVVSAKRLCTAEKARLVDYDFEDCHCEKYLGQDNGYLQCEVRAKGVCEWP